MMYSNKMSLLSFSDSLSMSHDASFSFVWYYWPTPSFPTGLCLFLLPLPLPLHLCLSTFALWLIFSYISPFIPLSLGALVPCSDCTWHELYNGFTALAPLKGITGIPEYLPVSLGVSVFFSCALCYWCIYLPFPGWLPWQFEALRVMSGTPPHQQFYTASKSFWCAVHTVSSSVFWNLGQLYYLLITVSQLL